VVAGGEPFGNLTDGMSLERVQVCVRNRDGSLRALRLRLDKHEPAIQALQGRPHPKRPGVMSISAPMKAESLTSSQAKRERDRKERVETILSGYFEQPTSLQRCQGFDFRPLGGRLDKSCDVSPEQAESHRVV